IQVPVDVDLQQSRRMVGGPPGRFRLHAIETERKQVKLIDKRIDNPDRIVLGDVVLESVWKPSGLRASLTFDISLHGPLARLPHSKRTRATFQGVFTQPRSIWASPNSGHS